VCPTTGRRSSPNRRTDGCSNILLRISGAHPAHGPHDTYPESTTLTKRRPRLGAAPNRRRRATTTTPGTGHAELRDTITGRRRPRISRRGHRGRDRRSRRAVPGRRQPCTGSGQPAQRRERTHPTPHHPHPRTRPTQRTGLRRRTPRRRHQPRRSRRRPPQVDAHRAAVRPPRHHGLRRIPNHCCPHTDTTHRNTAAHRRTATGADRRTATGAAVPTGPRRVEIRAGTPRTATPRPHLSTAPEHRT